MSFEDDDVYPPLPTETKVSAVRDLDKDILKSLGMDDTEIKAFVQQRVTYLHKNHVFMKDISLPDKSSFVSYQSLNSVDAKETKSLLQKLAVIKLNGGLGTSMGSSGGKGLIEVKSNTTFLDLTVQHIEHLNSTYGVDIPLLLMNSFYTDKETQKVLEKYHSTNVRIETFTQSKFPLMYRDTLNPVPKPNAPFNPKDFYPPGSGDVYRRLCSSGLVDKLIKQGIEYVFISNVENIGAVVDMNILSSIIHSGVHFALEVTDRINTDVSGGFLVMYKGVPRLFELSQVKPEKIKDFRDFRHWNTNNTWVNLQAVNDLINNDKMKLDWVANRAGPERRLLQIETPAGMAINSFSNKVVIHVPRNRFRPVKSTSQLLLAQSNLFQFDQGVMIMNPRRELGDIPLIKLGEEFSQLKNYEKRFKNIPDILELDHLTVSGDVVFGQDIKLKGTVIIVANHGEHIDIPDGVVLENKIVSGNLRVFEH